MGVSPGKRRAEKASPVRAAQQADQTGNGIQHDHPDAEAIRRFRSACFAPAGLNLCLCRSSQGLRPGLSCPTPAGFVVVAHPTHYERAPLRRHGRLSGRQPLGLCPRPRDFFRHGSGVRSFKNGFGLRSLPEARCNVGAPCRSQKGQWSDLALVEISRPGAAQANVFQRGVMKIEKQAIGTTAGALPQTPGFFEA